MDNLRELITERDQGTVPVSIGTALAIESVCGLNPEAPTDTPPILEVKELWVNLRTLYRNLLGSLTKEARLKMVSDVVYEALASELTIIESAVARASQGRANVVYYVCTYSSAAKKYPRALLRVDSTENQRFNRALEQATLKPYIKGEASHDVRVFDCEINTKSPAALMLTHYPTDLLARYSFDRLTLVESHTGTLKLPAVWNTKLTNGKELTRIPFCKFSLQLFGDGPQLFNAFPLKIRQELLALAERDNWTSVSSNDRIRATINTIYDPRTKTLFLSLL